MCSNSAVVYIESTVYVSEYVSYNIVREFGRIRTGFLYLKDTLETIVVC